jgi:hypothetical protein
MQSEKKGRHLTQQLTQRDHVEKIQGIIGKIGTVISHDGEDITAPVVTALTAANNAHLDGISLTQGVLDRHDAAVGRLSPSPSAQDGDQEEQGEVANAYHGNPDDIIVMDEATARDLLYELERKNAEYLEDLGSAVVTARTGVMQGSRAEVEARKKRI